MTKEKLFIYRASLLVDLEELFGPIKNNNDFYDLLRSVNSLIETLKELGLDGRQLADFIDEHENVFMLDKETRGKLKNIIIKHSNL